MMVEGKESKVNEYKFAAPVLTIIYIAFQIMNLLNDTASNPEYVEMMQGVFNFERYGVGLCIIIYDIIAAYKVFGFKKKGEIPTFIHPKLEKLIEGICFVVIIIGLGVACFF